MSFDKFPLWLRKGPWKYSMYFVLLAFVIGLIYTKEEALATYETNEKLFIQNNTDNVFYLRLFIAIWTISLLGFMLKSVGPWPLVSYTMISWSMITISNLAVIFGFYNVATILRFPSLV